MSKKKIQMGQTRAHGKANILDQLERGGAKADTTQEYKKNLITLPISDVAWIGREVERHRKNTKMRLNKSQLVQVALEYMRQGGGLTEALKKITKSES